MELYDYLIVGSGLFGATFAREMKESGCSCLVIDKRPQIGGNVRTEHREGVHVHMYGPHIFHTNDEDIWDYVNRFTPFNQFCYQPVANAWGKLYSLPFNMHTFYQMWQTYDVEEVKAIIKKQSTVIGEPRNLEEQAIASVGREIYQTLIKGYTEKQWGKKCSELPASIIKRLPVRFTFDNNYFSDRYCGIPEYGYTALIEGLLDGIEVKTNVDFNHDRDFWKGKAKHVIYTGPIDEFFGYRFGTLQYRSLRFEHKTMPTCNYQGTPVMNYTTLDVPFTRVIEHRHFQPKNGLKNASPVTWEYPCPWERGKEPFYPINTLENQRLFWQYEGLAQNYPWVTFGGRLGTYRYYDMHQVIAAARHTADMHKKSRP